MKNHHTQTSGVQGRGSENALLAIVENNDHSTLIKLQKFSRLLNRQPDDSEVQVNQYANNARYLPISFIEMALDEMFFGQWSVRNFRYHREINELIGSLELEVVHPITGRVITRTGAAAVQVMQERNTSLSQFEDFKKKNALEGAFPKLKAQCLSNAAASLGKFFGRDLNRRLSDTYSPLIPEREVA